MKEVHEAGSSTIIQDENTSVDWGMPGEAFHAAKTVLEIKHCISDLSQDQSTQWVDILEQRKLSSFDVGVQVFNRGMLISIINLLESLCFSLKIYKFLWVKYYEY